MRNPAKRQRLAAGAAGLIGLAAFIAFAPGALDRSNALLTPGLLLAAGFGAFAVGMFLLSAWVERASEKAISPFWMRTKPAFFGAILLTPVVIATAGLLLLPTGIGALLIFSLIFGAPAFWLVGAPLAWFALKRGWAGPLKGAVLGLVANVPAFFVTVIILAATDGGLIRSIQPALGIHMFGLVFGPIYGGLVGLLFDGLYGRNRRRQLGAPAPRQTPNATGETVTSGA